MKKIFTFAAAALASMTMMSQTVLFQTDFSDAVWADHDTICNGATAEETVNGIYFRSNNNSKYYTIADGALTFCDNNSGNNYFMAIPVQNVNDSVFVVIGTVSNGQRVNYLFRETNEIVASSVSMTATAANINTEQSITIKYAMTGGGNEALVMLGRQGSGMKTVIKSITISTVGEVAPVTDPVAEVTIAGPSECFVGQKATYTATTDVKATSYQWYIGSDAVEGATSAKFEFTPDATGSYSISCNASNENNSEAASSNVITLTVTERQALEQVTVTDHTTWDWSKAGTGSIEWTASTTPAKDIDTVLLANVDGINNDANFNAQALRFAGQYPLRDSKYCQGPFVSFEINSPGLVTVEFSNTGSKTDPRYIMVNGVVNTEVGSLNTTKVTSAAIAVTPGVVTIQGAFEDGTVQYLRIYKIVYQRTGWPTAIDNNEVELKAVKRIVNGQLLIEKNGVLYNAQGTVVK